mgnify:CR=1 FL=1
MRFTTKTEYGLNCLAHIARQMPGEMVTIKDIAQKEHFSIPYIEKIFQRLRSAHIVVSHQGKNGGYSLARHPSQITLREIIEALEGSTFDVFCEPEVRDHIICTHLCMCGIRPVWAKTKELLDEFYSSVTLETIAKEEKEAQCLISLGH